MRYDLWQRERERAEVLPNGLRMLRETSLKGVPTLFVWRPKALKPSVNYGFRTVERREEYAARQVELYDSQQRSKAERKATTRGTPEQLDAVKVGDIFEWSWGYDQTNLDYFQVVERRGRQVVVREIAQQTVPGSEGFMADRRLPVPGQFLEGTQAKTLTKLVQFSQGEPYLAMEFGWCGLWDGDAHYCSWYA
jgi:hypothetical protein